MKTAKLFAVLSLGALAFTAAQAPASAASQITEAFLANVQPNVDFLDRSSRLALAHAGAAGTRAYARSEASASANVASAGDTVVTGRSAAADGMTRQAANGRAPMGGDDIARLAGLSGKAFDDAYWAKQLDALSQLESDYRAYIAHGDNPALVALAQRELPKVMRRLDRLSKI